MVLAMLKKTILALALALCAVASFSSQSFAGTIIKLGLGGDSAADFEDTGGLLGVLSTADDGNGSIGDQNTTVDFLGALESEAADILTAIASFTLDGVTADGSAIVIGGSVVFQSFLGGTLSLYDASNALLLSGTLDESSLAGTLGAPATAGVITTTFGQFTGGPLAQYLDPNSLSLSISLADVNNGAGLSVTPPPPFPAPQFYLNGVLNAFQADATVIIAADPIPEPATIALLLMCATIGHFAARRKK